MQLRAVRRTHGGDHAVPLCVEGRSRPQDRCVQIRPDTIPETIDCMLVARAILSTVPMLPQR